MVQRGAIIRGESAEHLLQCAGRTPGHVSAPSVLVQVRRQKARLHRTAQVLEKGWVMPLWRLPGMARSRAAVLLRWRPGRISAWVL